MSDLVKQIKLEINVILNSSMTSYEIAKKSGVTITALDKYRSGKSHVENMTLKTAEKLLKVLEEIKKER